MLIREDDLVVITFTLPPDLPAMVYANSNSPAPIDRADPVVVPLAMRTFEGMPVDTTIDQSGILFIGLNANAVMEAQAIALVDTLWNLDFALRDEVGRMIQVWSVAELHDRDIPSRLVLSGHSGGRFFWGLGNTPQAFSGNLELRDLKQQLKILETNP